MKHNNSIITPDLIVCYDEFLFEINDSISLWRSNNLQYLNNYRANCSQIDTQYKFIQKNGWEKGSSFNWRMVHQCNYLNRLTGINTTIIDHPALLVTELREFYTKMDFLYSVRFQRHYRKNTS